jgi:biotin carboxylase
MGFGATIRFNYKEVHVTRPSEESEESQESQDERPLLLLIGSSSRRSRRFVLESVTTRYRLWLMQPAPVTWEAPFVEGNTVVDNTDAGQLVAAARALARTMPVGGVLCYDEGLVWPAAHVSQALGLPGNTPETVAACRDKHATRAAMAAAGVPQPASVGVRSLDEAVTAADRIGYPVVLKPRGLAGSMGVILVAGRDGLAAGYAAATGISYPGVPVFEVSVLVEEFVDGPEISIDAVSYDGKCIPLVLAHKQTGFEPYFEEVAHLVDGADPLLSDPVLVDALERSHKALGFHTGVTHTEFRLTERGPYLLEVNARLGGDMIPYLGELVSGVDVAMAAADAAAGVRPDTTPTRRRAAGVAFLYPDHDIEVESVTVHQERFGPAVHEAVALVDPGAKLRLPPRGYISRYGRVIATAGSVAEVRRALRGAGDLVTVAGQRLAEETA